MQGIDVSHYQISNGSPDPAKEASDVLTEAKALKKGFVFYKATEGTDPALVDSTAKHWAAAAKSLDFITGAYHFAHPEKNDPAAEADWFWWWVVSQDLAPHYVILDVEVKVNGNPPSLDWINKWCGKLTQHSGKRPFVYSSDAFFTTSQWTSIRQNWRPWVARGNIIPPNNPWTIWQYGQEQIAGRQIDVNVWDVL